jgi:hypothetical protein
MIPNDAISHLDIFSILSDRVSGLSSHSQNPI